MDDKPHEITGEITDECAGRAPCIWVFFLYLTGNSPGAVNSSQSPIGIGVAMPRKRTRQTGFGSKLCFVQLDLCYTCVFQTLRGHQHMTLCVRGCLWTLVLDLS